MRQAISSTGCPAEQSLNRQVQNHTSLITRDIPSGRPARLRLWLAVVAEQEDFHREADFFGLEDAVGVVKS